MKAATNQIAALTGRTNIRFGGSRIVPVIILVGLAGAAVVCAAQQSTQGSSATAEAVFADAVRPEATRLKTAREAVKRGDRELAIHDYVASIREDTATADKAITELVTVLLEDAKVLGDTGRWVDESARMNRCNSILQQFKQTDPGSLTLPEAARISLFAALERIRGIGISRARAHLDVAECLRKQAKGFWNDDEEKQAEALRHVNLAWSYYPAFTDESIVNKAYEIWADMKDELPTWQYNQVMERDRLQLGRVVGDR